MRIYLQSLDVCPFCGHHDTEITDSEVCEGELTESAHCLACDETWTNTFVYHHTNADMCGKSYYTS